MREYADRPIPGEILHRILEAGRSTGSSKNRQPWKFYVVRSKERLDALAPVVYEPGNIQGCALAIAVTSTSKSTFDAGRCIQNMFLAAWNEGIGASPNSPAEQDAARQQLGVPEEENIVSILSFGYPLHPRRPNPGDIEGILKRIKRKPLEELVQWVD